MKKILAVLLLVSLSAFGMTLEELKMEKRFGLGISVGGPLAIMGMELDVNFTETFSAGMGVGTGMEYNSWMLKARYFLMGKSVSPYFGVSVANWWTNSENPKNLSPQIINRFISPGDDLSKGFSMWLVTPTFGVQYLSLMGISFFAELNWMVKLLSLSNGLYAGLGAHWYF
jgi:hypothetical protein